MMPTEAVAAGALEGASVRFEAMKIPRPCLLGGHCLLFLTFCSVATDETRVGREEGCGVVDIDVIIGWSARFSNNRLCDNL